MNTNRSGTKVLCIATNATAPDLADRVKQGLHQRVDYFDLTERTGGKLIDYRIVGKNLLLQKIERLSNLDIRLALKATRLVKQKGFTTVISLSERVGIPLALMLPRSVKHIVIQHHPLSAKKILIEKLLRVERKWEQIITISQAEKETLLTMLDIHVPKIVAIHCPVDTDFFAPKEYRQAANRTDPARQDDHVESLGLSYRDYPTLIKAMQSLHDIPCHFRVGSTWVARDWGFEPDHLPANISIQPYVSPDVLREKIAQSRFIITPIQNFSQWSAGCTTVQIAQAMGKAVIATDLPGLREYLVPNKTGILVEPENPQAMAKAIRFLWDNPERASEMGQRGRANQIDNFSIDLWLGKMMQLINL